MKASDCGAPVPQSALDIFFTRFISGSRRRQKKHLLRHRNKRVKQTAKNKIRKTTWATGRLVKVSKPFSRAIPADKHPGYKLGCSLFVVIVKRVMSIGHH